MTDNTTGDVIDQGDVSDYADEPGRTMGDRAPEHAAVAEAHRHAQRATITTTLRTSSMVHAVALLAAEYRDLLDGIKYADQQVRDYPTLDFLAALPIERRTVAARVRAMLIELTATLPRDRHAEALAGPMPTMRYPMASMDDIPHVPALPCEHASDGPACDACQRRADELTEV